MSNLATFAKDAHKRVAAGAYACAGPALRANGSLAEAVAAGNAVLAELKPRSPSEGPLLHGDPADLLRSYKEGGAAAISALTDADHFGGSPDLLRQAHATGLPTLMKDFVVDEAQLDCARHCGASAVLLIERILGPARREELVAAAHARGLEVLLEVFGPGEAQAARTSAADLIGVNARDLDTLAVDPAAATILLGQIAHERPERPAVALSGVHDRSGARTAFGAGAKAVLVGTALLRSADPALLLRSMRRPLAKVCGLRTAGDVDAAAGAGADLVGIVVGSPGSPREVPLAEAARLLAHARSVGLRGVLVTRTVDAAALATWCREARPDYLQVHGEGEIPAGLAAAIAPTRLLAAFGPGLALPPPGAAAFLLDADGRGGSGKGQDWAALRPVVAAAKGRPVLVAGGLDAARAPAALRASHAAGADASSALESAPGRKDPALVRAFVQAVHAA